ncbi:hypothetical protein LPJ53_003572 [Coemansia erecta]|uniref:Myb-like domain-containing protein n=1 Tax=Coemansia erecta TaxID=147472 RepID=A0A9W7Y0W7_9FUNG|nr:hypothetical protein LPJ53_003572 [Coemansia erecta]
MVSADSQPVAAAVAAAGVASTMATKGSSSNAGGSSASHHPAPTHLSSPQHHQHQHRPYELQSPAPASRTFWNHSETGLLVQLWLEFEQQFTANKRNASVWAQLAKLLTERSGRQRTVRECRIKWKNMWAKHRDLVNASHMSLDAKLREFPHFADFAAIKQRSSHQQSGGNEGSDGKVTPSADDRRATRSLGAPQHQPLRQPPSAMAYAPVSASASASAGGPAGSGYAHRHETQGGALSPATAPMDRWGASRAQQHQPMYAHSGGVAAERTSGSAPYGYHYQRPVNPQSYDYSGSAQMEHEHEHEHDHEHERRYRPSLTMTSGRITSGSDEAAQSKSRSSMSSSALHNLLAPSSPQASGSLAPQAFIGDRMAVSRAAVDTGYPLLGRSLPQSGHAHHYSHHQRDDESVAMAVNDIPALLHQLDRSEDLDDDSSINEYGSQQAAEANEDSIVERMRTLAGASSPAAISQAAQRIMGYVERESRRRQMQSERHHRVVAALADILAQTRASSSSVAGDAEPGMCDDAELEKDAEAGAEAVAEAAEAGAEVEKNDEKGSESSETTPMMSPMAMSPTAQSPAAPSPPP